METTYHQVKQANLDERGYAQYMTINEAIPIYLQNVELRSKKATYTFYSQYLKFISYYLGDKNIYTLTRHDIDYMLAAKKKDNPKISNTTLNKYSLVAKSLYTYITDKKIKMRKLKEKVVPIPIIDRATIDKIFNYYEDNLDDRVQFRNYIYYRLSLDTGLRLSELLNVKMQNINLQENWIYVTVTKTDKDRYVVFTEKTEKLLRKFILLHYEGGEYLFTNFRNGKRLAHSSIETQTQALQKKLGIKQSISPHKWRHTFATTFIKKGGQTPHLKELMGHANLRTTQQYLHLDKDDLRDAYNKIFNQ